MNCQGMCWKCCRKSIKIPCDNDQKCRYMLYYLQLVYYSHISLRHLVEFVPSFPVIFLFFFHIYRKWFYTLANLPTKSRCKLGYVMILYIADAMTIDLLLLSRACNHGLSTFVKDVLEFIYDIGPVPNQSVLNFVL